MRYSVALLLSLAFGCGEQKVERIQWTTMGTVAAVQYRYRTADDARRATAAATAVRECFARIERLLNAHDPASELCRLAPLDEKSVLAQCDKSVSNCYAAAFRLRRDTGGTFNPRWRGAETLDLGAIAKGFAIDIAASAAADRYAGDLLIDLGGNLKSVRGRWRIAIAGGDSVLLLTNGMACATSGEYFRGKHIRDGRTGIAVTNDFLSVTVIHPSSAMLADGLSTSLFVLGRDRGERLLAEHYRGAEAHWVKSVRVESR